MKTTLKFLIPVIAVLLLLYCRKDDKIYNTYVYTANTIDQGRLSLYIDDAYRGEIPYLGSKLTCDNDTLKQKALFLTLKSGKYKIVAKDQQGSEKSSATLKISERRLSSKSRMGSQEMSSQGDCLIIRLDY